MRAINLTNRRFGKLTAINVTRSEKKRSWICLCDCGKTVIVPTFQLIAGDKASCGCGRLGVEIGQVFGLLTVIKVLSHEKYGHGYRMQVECVCKCGGKKISFSHYLTRGTSNHCGCLTKERQSLSSRKEYGESLKKRVIDMYRRNAKNKSVVFDLTNEEMTELFKGNCYYCGIEPAKTISKPKSYGTFTYNGIDRLNGCNGYVKSNVVSCCEACNYLKSDYTKDEFLSIIKRIANNHFLLDGKSNGTRSMIELAEKHNLPTRVKLV